MKNIKIFKIFSLLIISAIATSNIYGEASKKKILIGSPIRQKPAILKEFLQSLEEVIQITNECNYLFVDDNDNAESTWMLAEFAGKMAGKCLIVENQNKKSAEPYICNEITHYWHDSIIWKVASFKDFIIQYAREKNYDYLFLIDSDMVLHPNTIEQLIASNKDIVAEIWWTNWHPNTAKGPSVWLYDTYTMYEVRGGNLTEEEIQKRQNEFLQKLLTPGLYEVGGLCACTLVSKKALHAGVKFERIKNLSFWGEDRHFCVRALVLGLELWVDTHYPAYHIYRESELAGVASYKENCRKGIYQI
jgi:hypothetical protein